MTVQNVLVPLERLHTLGELERVRLAVSASRVAIYEWIAGKDRFYWAGDGLEALDLPHSILPYADVNYTELLTLTALREREDAIYGCTPRRPDFVLCHHIRPGAPPLCLEETGRCLFDEDGRLDRVVGSVRVIAHPETASEPDTRAGDVQGAVSRGALVHHLAAAMERGRASGEKTGYLVLAIDDLALVNDTYGFEVADELIGGVGEALRQALPEPHCLGRVSGNKFGIVLTASDKPDIRARAAALQDAIRVQTFETRVGALSVSVSAGGVCVPEGASSPGEAMSVAADTLVEARRRGPGSSVLHEPSADVSLSRRHRAVIADKIMSALREDRVGLAFQPICATPTRKVAGWECLVRIAEPDGHLIAAADFIPVAEEMGLVRSLDMRVLEQALAVLYAEPDVHLAVNISCMATTEAVWITHYLECIKANRAVADRLTIELTEHSAIQDIEGSSQFISRLRDMGCRIAIDDFGAGYTSFRNLQRLAIDMVKIDGSFVANVARDSTNQLFVRTLVDLARSFDLETTAEFVSNEDDIAFLEARGVDYLQGYYVGKPIMAPDWSDYGKVVTGGED